MREWISGRNPVYEVLRAHRRSVFRLWVAQGTEEKGHVLDILKMAEEKHLTVERVPHRQLDGLGESHQGVAVEVSGYPYSTLQDILKLAQTCNEQPFVLVLDTLQDPQNFGTLLRTAEAVGVHGVLIPLAHTVGVTSAVVRASAGASEHLLVARLNLVQGIERLKQAGLWVVGLEASSQAQPLERLRLNDALALVVGNEGEGLRALVRKSCDILVCLPMRGKIESLNAAVAGSVALYWAIQQRSQNPESN